MVSEESTCWASKRRQIFWSLVCHRDLVISLYTIYACEPFRTLQTIHNILNLWHGVCIADCYLVKRSTVNHHSYFAIFFQQYRIATSWRTAFLNHSLLQSFLNYFLIQFSIFWGCWSVRTLNVRFWYCCDDFACCNCALWFCCYWNLNDHQIVSACTCWLLSWACELPLLTAHF